MASMMMAMIMKMTRKAPARSSTLNMMMIGEDDDHGEDDDYEDVPGPPGCTPQCT